MIRLRPSPGLATGALVSAVLHAGWLLAPAGAHARSQQEPPPPLEVVELEPPPPPPAPPPPPPAPEPAPQAAAAPEPKAAPAPREARAPTPAAAPRAAAEAGRTLTAPDAPASPEVADFTMVQGTGDMYAGGTTASNGTSKDAVRGPAGGPPGRASAAAQAAPPPPPPAPEGPDRSRPATPASGSWSCSHLFPSDADGVNSAAVSIAVTVRPDGSPQTVRVLSDPGHGFGAAARACALSQRYVPALDRAGQAVVGTTPPFTVRFTR